MLPEFAYCALLSVQTNYTQSQQQCQIKKPDSTKKKYLIFHKAIILHSFS